MTLPVVTVGIDLDDTIVPWYEPAHRYCVDRGLTDGSIMPTTWTPYTEYGIEKHVWVDAMNEACLSGALYQEAPYDGVLDALKDLYLFSAEGNFNLDLKIVTARGFWDHSATVQRHTREQVDRFNIPGELVFAKDKTGLGLDYMLDDNYGNFEALWVSGVNSFLLDRPWNRAPDREILSRRLNSVPEYVHWVKAFVRVHLPSYKPSHEEAFA